MNYEIKNSIVRCSIHSKNVDGIQKYPVKIVDLNLSPPRVSTSRTFNLISRLLLDCEYKATEQNRSRNQISTIHIKLKSVSAALTQNTERVQGKHYLNNPAQMLALRVVLLNSETLRWQRLTLVSAMPNVTSLSVIRITTIRKITVKDEFTYFSFQSNLYNRMWVDYHLWI